MLTALGALLFGFVVLVWSADRFVQGAAGLASQLGVSRMMVGLTVVAFGTSAPEILVSATAALSGSPALAIGNAIGSNIANIGLVLAITAFISPIAISSRILRQEFSIYLLVAAITLVLLMDLNLGFIDGLILFACLVAFIVWLAKFRREDISEENELTHHFTLQQSLFWFTAGLILLLAGSRLTVYGAVELAQLWGINEGIIGLTIVALGTSLPELAASISAVLKKHHDLVVGNIIGSNILNLLTVLPMPALLAPGVFSATVITRDFSAMMGLSILLALLVFLPPSRWQIGRIKAALLMLSYLAYIGWLASSSL